MLEAKGPGYAWALTPNGWLRNYNGGPDMQRQMEEQSAVAGAAGRLVEWHVAEKPVADYLRLFAVNKGLTNVVVVWEPYIRIPKQKS
jgi:hypothetical protein